MLVRLDSCFRRNDEEKAGVTEYVLRLRAEDKVFWIGYFVVASTHYSGSVCISTQECGNELKLVHYGTKRY